MKIRKLFFESILTIILFFVILVLFNLTVAPILNFLNSILPAIQIYPGNVITFAFPLIAYLIFKYSMRFENENKLNLVKTISLAFLFSIVTSLESIESAKVIKASLILASGIIITFIYMFRTDKF